MERNGIPENEDERKGLEGIIPNRFKDAKEFALILGECFGPLFYSVSKGYLTFQGIDYFGSNDFLKWTIGIYGFSSAMLEGIRFLADGVNIAERVGPDIQYQSTGGMFPWEAVAIRNYFVLKKNRKLKGGKTK